jgi:hypothetical protein
MNNSNNKKMVNKINVLEHWACSKLERMKNLDHIQLDQQNLVIEANICLLVNQDMLLLYAMEHI